MANTEEKSYWHDALAAFGRMSGWIVGPILIALFLGRWLDQHFHTAPIIFVSSTALAFIISIFGLVKEGGKYMRSVEDKAQKQTDERHSTDNSNNN